MLVLIKNMKNGRKYLVTYGTRTVNSKTVIANQSLYKHEALIADVVFKPHIYATHTRVSMYVNRTWEK